jgi:acetyl-CoA acetyltransferase
MTLAAIYGVGTSRFARQRGLLAEQLAWPAVLEAAGEAGTALADIDAVFVGSVFGEPGVAQRVLRGLGISRVPVYTIENACASGATAFHEACHAVAAGRYRLVLALGVETMTTKFDRAIEPMAADAEGAIGFGMPAIYGMAANLYQHRHGLTDRQLALVAVKNFANALDNDRTDAGARYSVEEILSSRLIADPLTRRQCCSLTDAAAAAIVGPARGAGRDVRVRSSALLSGALWDQRSTSAWGFDLVRDTAEQALGQAGLGIEDIGVFEVHDAFTIGEIVTTEALGLCAEGEGGELVESGATARDGKYPVNPSGGLLARGHPLGATGLAQIAEICWQLRGEAGGRQVPGARLGLTETMGGGAAGLDGNACVVTVLEG